MGSVGAPSRVESLKERALQVLNLRYLVRSDVKYSYKKRIVDNHPDKHMETKNCPEKLREYEDKIKVINQAYELLTAVLDGEQVDCSKFSLLEDSGLVQSVLPEGVKPVPLGKTEQELWVEKWGSFF